MVFQFDMNPKCIFIHIHIVVFKIRKANEMTADKIAGNYQMSIHKELKAILEGSNRKNSLETEKTMLSCNVIQIFLYGC